ncbi:hypothetical protein FA13DRAFT_1714901 [Coprinellus micaceus]|uniref:Uncharacterized protein n=1 Tax=Coprinellus micaceus TaxID=71717 RepID=A0A4Y7SQS8_COPMI|nr:hypothetical protein FA13DRAFT_1714901 [Coprinellus micaceus]
MKWNNSILAFSLLLDSTRPSGLKHVHVPPLLSSSLAYSRTERGYHRACTMPPRPSSQQTKSLDLQNPNFAVIARRFTTSRYSVLKPARRIRDTSTEVDYIKALSLAEGRHNEREKLLAPFSAVISAQEIPNAFNMLDRRPVRRFRGLSRCVSSLAQRVLSKRMEQGGSFEDSSSKAQQTLSSTYFGKVSRRGGGQIEASEAYGERVNEWRSRRRPVSHGSGGICRVRRETQRRLPADSNGLPLSEGWGEVKGVGIGM